MATLLPGPKDLPRHRFVPLRRRKVLSPLSRGLILAGVFALWFCLSFFYGERDEQKKENYWTGRSLLFTLKGTILDTPRQLANETVFTDETTFSMKCVTPAVEQFPQALMGKSARQKGGLIVHVLVAVYMFMGLAIVADEYFVPALDKLAEMLNLPPDVAGATLMAAGSSGPELATAIIGVFVAKDDIGVSGVIGSAVFNITLVIGVVSILAPTVFILNWYSVVRDCSCYLISIAILLFTIANEVVSWPEALFFLLTYALYIVAMAFNSNIEELAKAKLPVPASWDQVHTVGNEGGGGDVFTGIREGGSGEGNGSAMEMKTKLGADGMTEIPMSPPPTDPRAPDVHAVEAIADPTEKPADGSKLERVQWVLAFPLNLLMKVTIPDCRKPQLAKFAIATFFLAIVWVCALSYMMVWMITVIGSTLNIPDTVMGLTFVAAGVSLPDALGGIAVAKEGHGDMAVSNSIGSNVFDILVCLGLPWFLQTAIVEPGSVVEVRSKGLVYSTFSLFSTVIFLIVASHVNGWKMDKKYGIVLISWYFVFIIFASLYELNIFGDFNPPECDSDF